LALFVDAGRVPGLTDQGLEIATIEDIRSGINAKWRAAFGQSMDVSDRSPDGQVIGIFSEPMALAWEVLDAIVSSQDPDKAAGIFLDFVCALTGTKRPSGTLSTVLLTATGTPTTTITRGSLVAAASTGQQFRTDPTQDVAIVALGAWVGSTSYATGDKKTNANNAYICTTGGTSAGSGGPIGTDRTVLITDGSAIWRFLGPGTGAVNVAAQATTVGAIIAIALDINQIVTHIGGWDGVVNLLDVTVGSDRMLDPKLRILRNDELARPGTSPQDAIRTALLDVDQSTSDPVTACTVFVNNTDFTDSDGLGPHSIEPMVRGGSDQAIWDALLANVAAGIRTHGTHIGTSIDSEGVAQTMAFSRVTEILIYVAVTLKKNPGTYPADGDAQVKAAIAAYGNALDDGADIVSAAVLAQAFKVAGVTDCNLPFIGIAPTPVTTTTITITKRQRGVWDTTRISITTSDFTP
jgi:hypothetical protein